MATNRRGSPLRGSKNTPPHDQRTPSPPNPPPAQSATTNVHQPHQPTHNPCTIHYFEPPVGRRSSSVGSPGFRPKPSGDSRRWAEPGVNRKRQNPRRLTPPHDPHHTIFKKPPVYHAINPKPQNPKTPKPQNPQVLHAAIGSAPSASASNRIHLWLPTEEDRPSGAQKTRPHTTREHLLHQTHRPRKARQQTSINPINQPTTPAQSTILSLP